MHVAQTFGPGIWQRDRAKMVRPVGVGDFTFPTAGFAADQKGSD